MADRTSAGIFAKQFKRLAKNPTAENKAFALELFNDAMDYDFSWEQMYCDEALAALDLAELVPDKDDSEISYYIYGPPGDRE